MKAASHRRSGEFDMHCRLLSEVIMGPGNLVPPSLYLMKKVVGCEDADAYACHVCVKDCMSWDHLDAAEWHLHAHDECGKCKQSRFVGGPSPSAGGKLRPRKVRASPVPLSARRSRSRDPPSVHPGPR